MMQEILQNKKLVIGVVVFFVLIIVASIAIWQYQRSQPDYSVRVYNEETGEYSTEFPNREEEDFEPEYTDIMNELPVEQRYFKIDYKVVDSTEPRLPVVITVLTREFPRPSSSTPQDDPLYEQYRDHVRLYRQEGIDYFTELGFEEDHYEIYFAEDILIDEFEGEYVGTLDEYSGDGVPPEDR